MSDQNPQPWRWTPGDNSATMHDAIGANDVNAVRRYLARWPDRLRPAVTGSFADTWLHYAVYKGALPVFDYLVDVGLTVAEANASFGDGKAKHSLLEIAASYHPELVGPLLERGADPRLGRPVIHALNLADEGQALAVVQALVGAGVDVNRVYDLYGDVEDGFTALEFAAGHPRVAAYLRIAGAVDRVRPAAPPDASPAEEVVAYFAREFGPVDGRSLTEIVPTTDPPVRVHIVPPTPESDCVTLFTTGLSTRPMSVPEGGEGYRFAELFLQLPAGWPLGLKKLARPEHGWPVTLLRNLAGVPHAEGTWLGGGGCTVANGDPPEPIGPGLPFTVSWLIAERSFVRPDGEPVRLYRVVPITAREWGLLRREGEAAFGEALDRAGVGMVIDPNRMSAV